MLACLSPNGMNRYDGTSAPDRLLVATSSGVTTLARESSGAWRKAGTALAGLHATTLTTLPGRPGIFVGTHGDGVLFSEDGARWEERNSGLAIKDVYTVASVTEAGGIALYAGTQPAALFKSRDLGQSWSELPALRQVPGTEYWTFPEPPHIAHTKMMAFDPRTPQRIYAAIEQGALLKTEDGGQSWRELADYSKPDDGAYRDVHQVMLLHVAARHRVHDDRRRPLSEQRWRRSLGAADRRGVPPSLSRPHDAVARREDSVHVGREVPSRLLDGHACRRHHDRAQPRSRAQLGHRAEGLRRGAPRQYRGADHGVLARRLRALRR